MKGTIHLPKVDAYGSGRRINAVDIEIELDDSGELHIVGAVWNGRRTDWSSGGQNHEKIAELYPNNATVQRVVEIWKRWHLNHMRAGTPAQEAWLREHGHSSYADGGYSATFDHMAASGPNPDKSYTPKGEPMPEGEEHEKGYSYGHAWLREELPDDIRAEVIALIKANQNS